MKKIFIICSIGLFSFINSSAQKKDSLRLSCPLTAAVEPPAEKPPYSIGVPEPKIWLTSADTTVRAATHGTVTNVMRGEDGKWELMFHNKDYYIWYSGVTKTNLKKGQKLQNGEAIGYLKPGDKLELMVYDFETPVDPRLFLNCK